MDTAPRSRPRFRLLAACVLLGSLAVLLAGCDGSDSTGPQGAIGEPGATYIYWIGSNYGPWVVDLDGDAVRFRSDTLQMDYNSTAFPETHVDLANQATVSINGVAVGRVILGVAEQGGMTALIQCSNGYIINFYDLSVDTSYNCNTGARPRL